MHILAFNHPSLSTCQIVKEKDVFVEKDTIIFNVSSTALSIGSEVLSPRTSSLFKNTSIPLAEHAILITSDHPFSALLPHPNRDAVMQNWTHVHDIFPLPHLEKTHLWRSPKEQRGNVAFNLWFAAAGTDCGLHNEHNFLEVHTQIWGTGHMQKFHEKDPATLYQDIFMTPGYTHEPFCDDDHIYPWHRYVADTDCIWLAVEYSG